ncbi:hypothetical protein BDR06DRAFT_972660 [Suillus hirtellus]|nr:hypothetical protein BDR06DRAFT_972660 [Suillus hirtellus]
MGSKINAPCVLLFAHGNAVYHEHGEDGVDISGRIDGKLMSDFKHYIHLWRFTFVTAHKNMAMIAYAISSMKEFASHRKRSHISNDAAAPVELARAPDIESHASMLNVQDVPLPNASLAPAHVGMDIDEDMCLAQRRPRHQNRLMPKRFRDVLPQPPPTVPVEVQDQPPESVGSVVTSDERSASPMHTGVQKSQGDFATLIEIVGDSTFQATDMSSTQWKKINCKLGANEYDEGDGEEWEDEDAGWQSTPVSIQVPFSHTTDTPGPQLYQAANLYHHSIITVM